MADKNNEEKKKKNPAPTAKAVKRRKKKGPPAAVKIPAGMAVNSLLFPRIAIIVWPALIVWSYFCFFRQIVFPTTKCKLRLLKLERIKDYLLMEQEFIQNQEIKKPREEQNDVSSATLSHFGDL